MQAKNFLKLTYVFVLLVIGVLVSSFAINKTAHTHKIVFPYAIEGLSKQQAAAHILNRFSYGATPQQVALVAQIGVEKWFEQQLNGVTEDVILKDKLAAFPDLKLNSKDILTKYPNLTKVRKMAIDEGIITEDEIKNLDKKELAKKIYEFGEKKGFKRENLLYKDFYSQKIYTAIYSNNQLHEVLTDFWFNHFNISMTKNQSKQYVPNYERDAIRPNILGNFENLVLATAKHPAMLLYLDNAQSQAAEGEAEEMGIGMRKKAKKELNANGKIKKNNAKGLNENYAREVMELHTLGVDGGYTQQDVTNAAKVLTGWTINPLALGIADKKIDKIIDKVGKDRLDKIGLVQEGDFMFAPQRHIKGEKIILGKTYADDGYNEGISLLKDLANHKSTAKFITKKIAIRFVNDNPKETLIHKLSDIFLKSNGNIKEVLLAMVQSKEFWEKDAVREKTKSPFEYAISSLRALHANVDNPLQINLWISKMGQQMYHYAAPTGFPDRATHWINTGSLLNRMNFGLALAGKRIPGVSFDLAKLNNNHEPESTKDALQQFAKILLPQRDIESTIKRLTPLIEDQNLTQKIETKVKAATTNTMMDDNQEMLSDDLKEKVKEKIKNRLTEPTVKNFGDNSMVAQVVGIIIGSPEFQRR